MQNMSTDTAKKETSPGRWEDAVDVAVHRRIRHCRAGWRGFERVRGRELKEVTAGRDQAVLVGLERKRENADHHVDENPGKPPSSTRLQASFTSKAGGGVFIWSCIRSLRVDATAVRLLIAENLFVTNPN